MDDGEVNGGDETAEKVSKKLTKREKVDKKRKIEEYLDEHIPLHVLPSLSQYIPYFSHLTYSAPNHHSAIAKSRLHPSASTLRKSSLQQMPNSTNSSV
jgi:hypothetical protein